MTKMRTATLVISILTGVLVLSAFVVLGQNSGSATVNEVKSEESSEQGDWVKEEGTRVPNVVSSCTVIILNATTHIDTYRMYYAHGGICSTFSSDGLTWTVEDGIRISGGEPGSNQEATGSTAVIGDPGNYRMIYEGVQGQPPNDIHRFFSANSTDGLNWTKEEGIRLESVGTSDYGRVSVPDIIELPNGSLRMYYVGDFHYQGTEGNSIRSAISYDFGLTWTREGSRLLGEDTVDPDVIKRGVEYRMFYTASPPGSDIHNKRSVYSALSSDGLNWSKEPGSRIASGGAYDMEDCADPDVVELPNGSYRMYYSGTDSNGENNILSAISPLTGVTTGNLTGTVTDKNGKPIEGATVSIVATGHVTWTDSNGRYTFTGVTASSYGVNAEKKGYKTKTETDVTINAGVTKTLNIVLEEEKKAEEKGFIPGFETSLILIVLTGCAIIDIRRRKKALPPEKPAGK